MIYCLFTSFIALFHVIARSDSKGFQKLHPVTSNCTPRNPALFFHSNASLNLYITYNILLFTIKTKGV
jgi:hypothetical protein